MVSDWIPPEVDGIPCRVGDMHIRPIYQLIPVAGPWMDESDLARWPVPMEWHDLDDE